MPRGLTLIDAPDRDGRTAAALTCVLEAQARGERVAWIVPTADMALAAKRHLADAARPLAGVEITTLQGWVQGRWTLWGDGRKTVNGMQRLLYVKKALLQTPSTCPSIQSRGMLGCLRDVVRSGAGLQAFEGGALSEGLSRAQGELMQAARGYFELLRRAGLVETGTAAGLLAADMPEPGWTHIVAEGMWNLGDVYIDLLGAAAAHAGVTYVGCLGDNGAFALERRAAELLEGAARARGCEVVRARAGETSGAAAGSSVRAGGAGEPAGVAGESEAAGCASVLAGACGLAGSSARADSGAPTGVAGVAGAPAAPARSPELVQLAGALFSPERQSAVQATGALRACLPAGRYAQAELLARQIAQLVDEDGIAPRDIVVAAADPQALAASLAGPLCEHAPRGIAVAASAPSPLQGSQVARFVTQWVRLCEAAWIDPDGPAPSLCPLAADLARNPLMGIPQERALKLARTWRSWRLTSASEYVNDLLAALEEATTPTVPEAEGDAPAAPAHMGERDLAWVLRMAQDRLPAARTPEADFERGAWASIARIAQAHRDILGRDPKADELVDLLDTVSVDDGWTGVPSSDIAAQRQARVLQASPNAVRVVRLADLDALTARAVVLCDLTADTYPLRERVDAKASLWEALGLVAAPSKVALLRHRFRAALECAGDVVVVERLLADEDAQATRPCALLEELIDCYRDDPSDLRELDRATGLPTSGCIAALTLGEEAFSQLASPVTYAPALLRCGEPALELDDAQLAEVLVARDALWSPSSLESLINCPLRWFYERRLPTHSLDAPFADPMAQGSFCHLVLQRFHEALGQQTGTPRIMPGMERASWEGAFACAWDEAVEAQHQVERPFVAVGEMEAHKLQGVRRRLLASLECERFLPVGFIPQANELEFGHDEPVVLGEARIHGIIDRLDIDEGANALLVVDYKGGLGSGHGPVQPEKDQDPLTLDILPQHSQILMYLAAARQLMPEKSLAGGLYVSYAKPACAGFVDARLMGGLSEDKRDYLNRPCCEARPAPDGTPGVEALLERVEAAVREALDELSSGVVVARPRFGKDSCQYCPIAQTCPRKVVRA